MRFFLVCAATLVATYFALMLMPWWISMPVAFILVLLLPLRKKSAAFLAPALGSGVCWLLLAALKDYPNHHLLSQKIASLFHLPSFVLLILVCGLIGFVTAGLGGWTAAALQALFKPSRPEDKTEEAPATAA